MSSKEDFTSAAQSNVLDTLNKNYNLNIKYTTSDNGILVVNGDLNMSWLKLKKMPDLSNVSVKGNFYAQGNLFEDLKGCPIEVTGGINLENNPNLKNYKNLTTKYAALFTDYGIFNCGDNSYKNIPNSKNQPSRRQTDHPQRRSTDIKPK